MDKNTKKGVIEEFVTSALDCEIRKEPSRQTEVGASRKQVSVVIEGLLNLVNQFLDNGRLESGQVSHYTKTDVLPVLLNYTNKFRLYNVDYLNDPQEGQVFLDYFLTLARKKNNPFMKQLCASYQKISEKKSDVYIASFTTNSDTLPLWSMYGDDGKGVSLTVAVDSFQKGTDENLESKNSFKLQKVHYIELNSQQQQTKAFRNLCKQLLRILEDYSHNLIEQIMHMEVVEQHEMVQNAVNYAIASIDRIRFLFKDVTYKHEEEYRLISIAQVPLPKYEDLQWGQDMRLYVELDQILHYDLITIGPNCPNQNVVRQLSLHSKYVREVKTSKIKYRS